MNFILNQNIAIEAKGKTVITSKDLKGLKALKEEGCVKSFILVSLDPIPRKVEEIQLFHWKGFLSNLWQGFYLV